MHTEVTPANTTTVTPTAVDPEVPASFEVGEQGMYLHVGNATIDLDEPSQDPDAHEDRLRLCKSILAALAADLPAAIADVDYHLWQLGEKCGTCNGAGGHEHGPHSRHGRGWEDCPYCDGKGRIVADRMPAA